MALWLLRDTRRSTWIFLILLSESMQSMWLRKKVQGALGSIPIARSRNPCVRAGPLSHGGVGRIRTFNQAIMSRLLYP